MSSRGLLAVCAGSFDPVTPGHLDVITRATALFGEVIALVAVNPAKAGRHPVPRRLAMLREVAGDRFGVDSWDGLLVDYCRKVGADVIVRGIRTRADLAQELAMAEMNLAVGGVRTIFLPTSPGLGHVSSTLVTELGDSDGGVTAPA
ncbi:pantetheine-phosphate adenylyltransferase [Allokutzneria sp. A3M-2-11 16]|uniref:pantetheine-phosphate adenylyltransferase n=1 Tax=Allokutzneria sp. A3M-2-11 16 TaxID=2962043 RepID=UPI0020B7721A|nr:pantetheine-phosphate adenylyltransferase [Allokutzneria sp. A3M-2-11 16]MCP3803146.1 pantetheine-phosphate adenylyltransferase [Allokutzneria sp. A3M-2-11 16]